MARVLPLMDQPACEIGVVGHLKGVRPGPQVPQGAEAIPLPDLLLPKAVVAFDLGVGGGLPIGHKDRDDSTGQAESNQLPQTAGMESASRQAHVVVHLDNPRTSMTVPVPRQKRQHALDSSVGLLGPADQPRGHVLAGQDDDGTASPQIMSDDEVELVHVVLAAD